MTEHWIHKTWEYKTIYREGGKQVGKNLVLYTYCHGGEKTRFGITVTKKIGKAVVRNRAKRLIREVIRQNLQKLKYGYDFVVVSRKKIITASYRDIQEELVRMVNSAIS
jgi:ribonuclease P protein component